MRASGPGVFACPGMPVGWRGRAVRRLPLFVLERVAALLSRVSGRLAATVGAVTLEFPSDSGSDSELGGTPYSWGWRPCRQAPPPAHASPPGTEGTILANLQHGRPGPPLRMVPNTLFPAG